MVAVSGFGLQTYPHPIVDHKEKSKDNMSRMKAAFAAGKYGVAPDSQPKGGQSGGGKKRGPGINNGGQLPASAAVSNKSRKS